MVVMQGSRHTIQKVRLKYSRLTSARDNAVSLPPRLTESSTPSDIVAVELNMTQHTLQVGKKHASANVTHADNVPARQSVYCCCFRRL